MKRQRMNDHFNLFKIVRSLNNMDTKVEVVFTAEIKESSNVDDLKLILNQSELRNKSLNENAESLYQKSLVFLSISLTALTSLVVYISSQKPVFTPKYVVSCAIVLLLIAVCNILKKNVKLHDYYGLGCQPCDLVHKDFYTNLENKTPEWYILERLIRDCQVRVESNDLLNKNRAKNIQDAIEWLFWTPGVAIIIYVLFFLFPGLWL